MDVRSITQRVNKVTVDDLGDPYAGEYIDSLPDLGSGAAFTDLVLHYQEAIREGKHIIIMIGGHVIKCGVGPHISRLIAEGGCTHVAMNGAAAIHDYELARWGGTSEDVEVALPLGEFGMWAEAAEINDAYISGGLMAANCMITIHPAIGTDYPHWFPGVDGAEYGRMSFRELGRYYDSILRLEAGSIVLNLGSAVILPEIWLKAISKATNEGKDFRGVICANFDMGQPYRALQQIVHRPRLLGMTTYNFVGMHELMIPLLMREVLGANV